MANDIIERAVTDDKTEDVANSLIDTEFTRKGLFGSSGSLICFGKKISVTALSF